VDLIHDVEIGKGGDRTLHVEIAQVQAGIRPIIQPAQDGEIRQVNVAGATVRAHPSMGLAVQIPIARQSGVPPAGALQGHAGRQTLRG